MQQWLNMQMCLKASVLCRPQSSSNYALPAGPHSVFCSWDATTWMQTTPRRRSHSTGRIASLSVVEGCKEGASCSDQVYSKYDSWTSGYRPHITQVVNLWLVDDPNLCKRPCWWHIFPVPHFLTEQSVFGCDSKKAKFAANSLQEIGPLRVGKDSLMQQKRTRK